MIRGAFIGIDRHRHAEVRDLNGAARDASALWALLSDSIDGLEARLITDYEATKEAVLAVLDGTLDAAGAEDVVLLSFAGHGTTDHRLVLSDTDPADIAGTTIEMAELAGRFRRTRARAVILLLDCCFSGGAPARVLDVGIATRDILVPLAEVSGNGRILFAASSPNEAALEDPSSRHGLFTKAILDILLSSGDPISVVGLADQVVRDVRASAARFGYEQTPVLFGHVEGELTLPPGRRGDRFLSIFPELVPVRTTGDFIELASYGIPPLALQAWEARFPAGLNKLQIDAVNEHGVLNGASLLVVAPTSSGKTFVGELAALKAITEGRKAIFLLPYKALVNEKFEDFTELYGNQLGLRVARCSGDWQDQVGDVLRGKYDIAFFTYEKFLGLVVAYPHILNQTGLVVLDEAQFITEPGRGMAVELLLTSLLSARRRGVSPQLIALSAVIGNTNGFERWLDCRLLLTTDRPVPLTEGVMDRSGAWRFGQAGQDLGTAEILDRYAIRQRGQRRSSQDMIVPLVRHLVGNGGKVIVFRGARGSAGGCAEYLARELGLPAAQKVIDALPEGDLSAMSQRLRNSLAGGVAFHNGDLTRDERVEVERGFRSADDGVHVLVATSTVAAGVNTPASTVVIVETDFPTGGQPQPYTVAQYKNMAGRAGRLGFEAEGKAIALADTHIEREDLFRRYVMGQPEAIRSSFDPREPGTWVLRLLGQVADVPRDAVVDLIANTFGGYLAALRDALWRERMAESVGRLIDRMTRDGLIDAEGELIHLTMLGRACAESPLGLESSMQLVELLRRVDSNQVTQETLLVLLECLPERDDDYTPQLRNGEAGWQQQAGQRFGYDITRLLRTRAREEKQFYGRCKRALIVSDWISGIPTNDIEERYSSNAFVRVGHGDIRGFADGSRYLLESASRITGIVLERPADEAAESSLLKRLDLGVPAEALPLADLPIALNRGEILSLWAAGLTTTEALLSAESSRLRALIGRRAEPLRQALRELA